MKQFAVKPEIFMCDTCKEFCDEYKIGKGDLILSNEYIFEPYFSQYVSGATVVYVEKYGTGEPSDEMVEAIYADIKNCYYRRVFAIGGGTIIDVSKLFALEKVSPVLDLYDHKIPAKKRKRTFYPADDVRYGKRSDKYFHIGIKKPPYQTGTGRAGIVCQRGGADPGTAAGTAVPLLCYKFDRCADPCRGVVSFAQSQCIYANVFDEGDSYDFRGLQEDCGRGRRGAYGGSEGISAGKYICRYCIW